MLFHFQFELSNIDQSVYETLDFRIAQHPSETPAYLLTRALAYALSYQEGLQFSAGGLADPEGPALQAPGVHGAIDLWIEIGNPSARKLHRASKSARQVIVYTYKNPEILLEDIRSNQVHRAADIRIYAFEPKFLQALQEKLQKNNRWAVVFQQGQLEVTVQDESIVTDVRKFAPNTP